MNFTVKASSANLIGGHRTLIPAANNHQLNFSGPISFISLKSPPKSFSFSFSPIKASGKIHKPNPSENLRSSRLPLSFLKTSFIATTAAAVALLISQFHLFSCKPAIASPGIATVESTSNESLSDEEKEKLLEEHLVSEPNDIEALQSLMEIRIRNKKTEESISIIEKLIKLEPEEVEWPLMKAHMHAYAGESELARKVFDEIIAKDPLKVEAYHGLVVAASQDDVAAEELGEIEKRIEEAMNICEKEDKKNLLTDFKLLQAQIFVMKSQYADAILLYKQLAKEEPRDFRPYLCQGIIFTVLKNKKEAEKNFEKYRSLVPKEHPYARYFEDNMIATKAFAQKMENVKAGSQS